MSRLFLWFQVSDFSVCPCRAGKNDLPETKASGSPEKSRTAVQNVQKKKGSESPARRDSKYAVACVTCVLGQIRYADVVAGVEDQTELEIVGQTYRNRQVERFIYVLGIDFDVAFFRFGRQQEAG